MSAFDPKRTRTSFLKAPIWIVGSRFRSMRNSATVFGGWEESSGKSRLNSFQTRTLPRNRPECGVFRQVPPCLRGCRNPLSWIDELAPTNVFVEHGPPPLSRHGRPPSILGPAAPCQARLSLDALQAPPPHPPRFRFPMNPVPPSTATSKPPSSVSGPVAAGRTPCTAILGTRRCPHPDGCQIALPAAVQEGVRPVAQPAAAGAAPGGHCNDQVAVREMWGKVLPVALRPWGASPPAWVFKTPGPGGQSGSKGRKPVVGIQWGGAPSTSSAWFIMARNFLLCVQGPVPGRRKAGNRGWRKARQTRPGAGRR